MSPILALKRKEDNAGNHLSLLTLGDGGYKLNSAGGCSEPYRQSRSRTVQVGFSVRRPGNEAVGPNEESSQVGAFLQFGSYDTKPAAPARAQGDNPDVVRKVK